MDAWYGRTVFFVSDTSRAVRFYVDQLGFAEDWRHAEAGEVLVAQVSHAGFELILNQDEARAGHGRIYFHLTAEQIRDLRDRVRANGLATRELRWGMPITEILDPDHNQLFFDSLLEA